MDVNSWRSQQQPQVPESGEGDSDVPPPIPPRSASTRHTHGTRHSTGTLPPSYGVPLDGFPTGPQPMMVRPPGYQSNMYNTGNQSRVSMQRPQSIGLQPVRQGVPPQNQSAQSALISLSPPATSTSPWHKPQDQSTFISDLEGLDFSMQASRQPVPEQPVPDQSNQGPAGQLYPDISSAFRDLENEKRSPRASPLPMAQSGTVPGPLPMAQSAGALPMAQSGTGNEWKPPAYGSMTQQRNSMPSPYGWDSNLTQMASGGVGHGSLSVPTTPVHAPYFSTPLPQPGPPGMPYNMAQAVPPMNPNFVNPYGGGSFHGGASGVSGSAGGVGQSAGAAGFGADNASTNSNPPSEDVDGFNFVPDLDFDSWMESDAFAVPSGSGSGSGDASGLQMEATGSLPGRPGHQRNSSDLIQLGFESMYTPDEKEYFSLQYFDPLHKKGRTASISSPSPGAATHYFFAKPPEETDVVSKDRDAWVTFDGGEGVFGIKDRPEGDAVMGGTVAAAGSQRSSDVADVAVYPASEESDDVKGHEKLRKKLYVDEESDAFCQMVADLKEEYKSTDTSTNLGFIVSPMCDKQQEAMSVKIVVHSDFAEEPFTFTSDVQSLVEHVINHVLYSCLSNSLPRHMVSSLKSVDFILKVNDKSEYLLNEFALCRYSYTHDCLKMDQDLCFRIMRRQDVALPFLRTIDDDNQQLYFPQDHVRDTEVTRESLEILMGTFYREAEKITDLVLKDQVESVKFQSLSQSVKAICNVLSKIETIDIAKSLHWAESKLKQLKDSMVDKRSTIPAHQDGGYATLQRNTAKASFIPSLEEALEALVKAVKRLVRIYCQAFHTDFHLDSRIDQPWDPQDLTGYNEHFIVQVCTVHRLGIDWETRFDEYRVECCLYHGKKKLSPTATTTCSSVNSSGLVALIVWDEWVTFEDVMLCNLPRETRLCMTLIGQKNLPSGNPNTTETQKHETSLGGVTVQLFNSKSYMLQGSQLVPFQMNSPADPITPFCSTLQTDSALLQFNLPDFSKQIKFSEPLRMSDVKKQTFKDLSPTVREEIQEVLRKDCVQSCTADQLEVLWMYRYYLHDQPRLLPWILQAARRWDWASLPEIYCLLKHWATLQPMQALELLLPQYPDQRVRAFAVDCLRKMPTDDLINFIPQLIQALKFESYHSSPLARLLLEQSCRSVKFAHQFFWLLKGATQESLYQRRYTLMFVALVSVTGESLYQEFLKQEQIVKVFTNAGQRVQQAKGPEKDAMLKNNLEDLYDIFQGTHKVLLPYNPGYEVSGLDINSCSYFTSNAFPLKLVFKNVTTTAGQVHALFKVGDDLRQDMMIMQVIQIMDRLWLRDGLDLKMITFSCLPTGPRRGFIEIVTESDTLRRIQISSGVTGSFKDRPIKDWLQKHNPTELDYQKAVENFTRSCAGYCVATYILGVCDRHNDNIMLKETGHLFHIDFNKILGDSQMFGNFKRDRVRFVLTSDMAYVINDGDRQSDKFQSFIDMCIEAFNILRKHANLFINLFSLMLRSGIPGITEKGVEFVQKALLPGLTDTQAAAEFSRMIQESLSAKSTQINFFIHNLAQMKFSSHQEGALLSFVPKAYTQQTDGKIIKAKVYGIQKRYTPEKHYIYTLQVERESQKVPSYIFRIFSEFVEFRNKMAACFPLVNWPPLQGRVLLGRSHVKTVAENRKLEIERFLDELWRSKPEVSHCELMYTFFHPLLRDEQEAQKERLTLPKLRDTKSLPARLSHRKSLGSPTENTLIQPKDGQVKLSLEYVKHTLQVMVMHAKDLPVSGSELPSPYVKLYLLPDPEKLTKRKTKIIKNSTHPTYNELIEYKLALETVRNKTLQVTIWDHDVLMENNLLGAVYIRLRDVSLTDGVPAEWYKLEKIQITDTNTLH